MSEAMSNGPFCQRCGMPLEKPEDFGTAASGSASTTTVVGAMRVGFSPNRTFRWSR
nr:zinc ribbon domain-containing protein [Aminiphilus circumscriptus]